MCGERKLFYKDCEEKKEQEQEPSQDVEIEEITPTITFHALVGNSTPQSPKIEGYIKNKKIAVLTDSNSIYNFIHYKLVKILYCFVYPTPKFQVMIIDGGNINCLGKYHNINHYGGMCNE